MSAENVRKTELAITIAAGVVLVGPWGLSGIAAGFAIGAWTETAILLGAILAKTRVVDLGSLARGTATFLVAAVGATVTAWPSSVRP